MLSSSCAGMGVVVVHGHPSERTGWGSLLLDGIGMGVVIVHGCPSKTTGRGSLLRVVVVGGGG